MAKLRLSIPMRWSDLDAYGHVNNVRLLTILEEARIKAFWVQDKSEAAADVELSKAAKIFTGDRGSGTMTVIAAQRVEYLRPVEWTGDDLVVDLWLGAIGGASMEVCYEVYSADGDLVAIATTTMVVVDAEHGAPQRIPEEDRAELTRLLEEPVTFRR